MIDKLVFCPLIRVKSMGMVMWHTFETTSFRAALHAEHLRVRNWIGDCKDSEAEDGENSSWLHLDNCGFGVWP